MTAQSAIALRQDALRRAEHFSPFLRSAIEAAPAVVDGFLSNGAAAAAALALAERVESIDVQLRKQRQALALAVALGDLAGALSLERGDAASLRFCRPAIDQAVAAAIASARPGHRARASPSSRIGKLGSRELNYSSDVDLIFLFDRRPCRAARARRPGEAAVRIGQRIVEILQKRTAEGYVARSTSGCGRRPRSRRSPAGRRRHLLLRIRALCRGSGRPSSARGPAPETCARQLFPRGHPAVRVAALARFRSDRRNPRDFGRGSATIMRKAGARPGLRPQARPRRHPRGRVLHPDPPADPRRPRARAARAGDARRACGAASVPDASRRRTPPHLRDAYRLLRTVEHRLQMVEDRQTHLLPRSREALDNVARLHGLATGDELIELLRPHVDAGRSAVRHARRRTARAGCRTSRGLRRELAARASPSRPAARRVRELALGQGALAAHAGGARSVRGDAAGAARGDRAGPDPMRAINRFSDIVERLPTGVNFYRLLEARPALAEQLALILSHAPPLADMLARRPDLLDGLIDEAASPAARARGDGRAPSPRRARRGLRPRARPGAARGSTSGGSRSACN